MPKVNLFTEDFGHEEFLKALLKRFMYEFSIEVEIESYSVRGGHGKALTELEQYMRDLRKGVVPPADLLAVAIDSNCRGYAERKREVERISREYSDRVICAIPDPHIERWFLLDSAAFKLALGRGCQAPDHKCDRGRYKKLLIEAVREAGVTPLLGGIEHADDIVAFMDLERMEASDDSLGKLISELRSIFRSLQEEHGEQQQGGS